MGDVNFTACRFLDFDRSKYTPSVKMNLISNYGQTKIVWNRKDPVGNLHLCQFCSERGRLNEPDACLTVDSRRCGDYEDAEHSIPLSDIDTG